MAAAAGAAPPGAAGGQGAAVAQQDAPDAGAIHDWDNLGLLRQGDRIAVTTSRNRVLEGRFVGHTPQAIAFSVDGEPVSIDRENVVEVLRKERSHRVRNAVLTLGVSLLVGLISGSGAEASSDREGANDASSSLSLHAGAATLDALPDYPVIYRAPGPSRS
jgi:hypothetical protein